MILEKQTEALVQQEGQSQDSIGMSLDLDSAQILMQMLSKNLYSDSIGSTVRECASNALDSHRRAGVDKPIIVSFGRNNDSNNYEFSVEDFGIGLDAEDVKNIISKYGKSTKRNSATELGMMGLGFKAPLAYSSSFYFVCRKNGMERKYMMYEGEDTNTIDLLYEKPTTEGNGVKVIVPVNHYDRREFTEKISEQLAYFQNVYFNVEDFDNSFTIIRSEHFQWSPLTSNNLLHICLDDVYYPIEFAKLGIDTVRFPVGLRFGLTDGIFPTPNRESIRYTKEAKDIILKKIELVADYFVQKYNESIVDTDNITEIMNFYADNDKNLKMFSKTLDVSTLGRYATIPFAQPKLKGINHLDLQLLYRNKDYILGEYDICYNIDRGRWRERKHRYHREIRMHSFSPERCYLFTDRIPGKMKDYLKSTHPNTGWGKEIYIVKKTKEFKLGNVRGNVDYKTYITILRLDKYPKHLWREMIKEFQYIVSLYVNRMMILENVIIPQEWLDAQKKAKVKVITGPTARRVKLAGEIVGKLHSTLERYVDGKQSKQVSTIFKLEDAHKQPFLHVYGNQEDSATMDKLFKLFSNQKVKFIAFSERELKNLENLDLHNWMKFSKFMKGDNKPFRRVVTARLISELIDNNRSVFRRIERIASVSTTLASKLDLLDKYKDKHDSCAEDKLYATIMPIAIENNLFDMEIYDVYKEVNTILSKFRFIETICSNISHWGKDDGMLDVLRDMLKYHRQRLDWQNYKIVLTEESALEQPLTTEKLEDILED